MKQIAQRIYTFLTHEYFLYAIVLAVCIGTYYARAAVSIATVLLGVVALLTAIQSEKRKEILKNRSIVAITAVFLVAVLSGLISSNTEMWLYRICMNFPYLALPVGVWAFGPFSRKTIVQIIMIFVVVTSVSALAIMVDYVTHFEEYNELYLFGKTIPTPISHVRYSYFLALAAICCVGLLLDKQLVTPRIKMISGAMGVFLAICVHILAVRTGLVALYGGVLTLAVLLIIREGKWQIGIGAVIVVVLVSAGSIKFLPSMYNKLGYVLHDLNMLTKKVSPEYSDNIRVLSIHHGINIFLENPVFGVGVGDIKDVAHARFAAETPSVPADRRYIPISQYIFWLASYGLLGTFLLVGLLTYPLCIHGKQSYLLWAIYAVTAFSLIGELTILLQLGKTMFLFLVVVVLQWDQLRSNKIRIDGLQYNVE
jgi:O-antigen ligase